MSGATVSSTTGQASAPDDRSRAAQRLKGALERNRADGTPVPKGSWYDLAVLLYGLAQYEEAIHWAREGLKRFPKDGNLHNILGVLLKNLGRLEEAAEILRALIKLEPKSKPGLVNLGNVYLALHDGPRAVEVFRKLARAEPRNGEYQRLLGAGYRHCGDLAKALKQFEAARKLSPDDSNLWIDITAVLEDMGRHEEAIETTEAALARFGRLRGLVDTRIKLYRRNGRHGDAIRWMEQLAAEDGAQAWMVTELARTIGHTDRVKANTYYEQAHRLDPADTAIMTAWADNLDRTRGPQEMENIAAAYKLALERLAMGGDLRRDARVLRNIFVRAADYKALDAFGTFEDLGRHFAVSGQEAALHYMMSQVRTPLQRRDLLSFHKVWGDKVLARVAQSPIPASPAIVGRAKIRVGFMSSDLRNHPVAYFVHPLLTGYDRKRFEFYCYSWCTQPPDPIEQAIARSVDVFRKDGSVSDRNAAILIAQDSLDILFELGGSTDMNKIETMAYRPAVRQASWLGYPHSAGLSTIDRILVDPYIMPDDPALLIEKSFKMTRSWVALHKPGFGPIPDIDPVTPQERKGFVTFGTMNGTYKYNAGLFETWAEVLRRVPGSEFLFVRPESATSSFRANVAALFEKHGIDPARIRHVGVRGTHMPHYNDMDVALDTFPQTGGTTTCETLWMGVPCVTLVGEAFFERLSYSNLSNAGLGELCTFDRESYIAKAVEVAGRMSWRTELRRTIRDRLRQYPLGRPDLFVEDFEDSLSDWMDEARP